MNNTEEYIYKYCYTCINCNTDFNFSFKDNTIEKATCPVCEQSNTDPKSVTRIQELKIR